MATKKKSDAEEAGKSDRELLEQAGREHDRALALLRAVVLAVRYQGKPERLAACDEAEEYLGGPVRLPLNGEVV